MSFIYKAGELARDAAEDEYATRDLDLGCRAPDNDNWSNLYAAPSVNADGSIALPLIDWPSVNPRVVNVDPDFEITATVIPG